MSNVFLYHNELFSFEFSPALLKKKYNQVAFAAAHNAQSWKQSSVSNQDLALAEQLKQGIRALKIHVWPDKDNQENSVPCVCHGLTKDFLSKTYLDEVAEKVPRLFRPFARELLKKMEPLNDIIRRACATAYGEGESAGAISFPHCIFDPARRSLRDFLGDIYAFLKENPKEIITLILEDHTNNIDLLAANIKQAGLAPYAHKQNKQKSWPILGDMVKSNKRLILFVQSEKELNFQRYSWILNLWDFAWDTEWHFETANDLLAGKGDTIPKRGKKAFKERHASPHNKIFIVHHFVTEGTGGSKTAAKKVNKKTLLLNRLKKLSQQVEHIPNIVQVDFFEYPNNDIFEVIKQINEEYTR